MKHNRRNPRRRSSFISPRNGRPRASRRPLRHEPLEARLALDASGFPGNFCPPDLDLSGIEAQTTQPGEELVLDLLAAGGTVADVDADGNPTGDTIHFQLDPDDTPEGATITSDGVFRWTPAASQLGSFEFVVLAADSGDPPLADAEVFVVEVEAIQDPNQAPDLAAIPDASVAANGMLEVTINATDEDGDNLAFVLDRDDPDSTLPDDAVLEQLDNNTAVIRWTPDAADAGGTFDFSVIVTDDGFPPLSDREVFAVSVSTVAAVDDTYQTGIDEVLTVDAASGVLVNDSDSDGDPLTAVLVTGPTNGTLDLQSNGSFTYTPTAEFQGTDSFTYRAEDGTGDGVEAVVTIRVNAEPAAQDDTYDVDEDATLTVDAASGVLSNDSDADDDTLMATLVSDVSNGSLTFNGDGSFTYVPEADFTGTDSFTYRASDGIADSMEATVTLNVAAVNNAPESITDSYSVDENATLTVDAEAGVLANDSDPDGDPLSATLVEPASDGTVSLNSDGSFTYIPDIGFSGSDTFTYVANDGTADSQVTTVVILVIPLNDAPEAVDDAYSIDEGGSLTTDAATGVLANDTDPDEDPLTAALVDNVSNGTLTLNANGSFTYTPDADFSGTDTFTYTATDGVATSAAATVTITVVEQNTFSVSENAAAGAVVGQVSPEGDLGTPVVYFIEDPSLHEALELAADDHIEGNPAAPVVLVEYVDFQCPVCRAFNPIVDQLVQGFPDDLMVVTRHYPLPSIHQNAMAAAVAAEAAGRQDAFAAFGDLLFEEQDEWEFAADPQPFFEGYATQLGLDLAQFQSDQADPALSARVLRDFQSIATLGGTGTPTFFLNGEQITNPTSLEAFESLIQSEVDAVESVFAIDRLTGQITVRDADALDFETDPSYSLTVRAVGLQGSETIDATIQLVDEPEGTAAAAASVALLDHAFEEDGNWWDPLHEPL